MSEMVERVAQALDPEAWQSNVIDFPGDYVFTSQGSTVHFGGNPIPLSDAERFERQQRSLYIARAAIEAMSEPTETMIRAAMPGHLDKMGGAYTGLNCWRAMIDAALAS